RGPGGQILKPATLEQLWTPQFAKSGEKTGFGIGFHITELAGRKCVGHSGAVYGFATELSALPGEKLGVVVVTTKDCANAVTKRIGDTALAHLRAVREGRPLPEIHLTTPLSPDQARRLAGRYTGTDKGIDLIERGGKLFALPLQGG